MSDLKGGAVTDFVHRHEATLHLLKLLVADLVTDLPIERQHRLFEFLNRLEQNTVSALDQPMSLPEEVTLDHLKAAIIEMRNLVELRRP